MSRPRWRVALVLAALVGIAGCGTPALTGTVGKDIKVLPASTLPTTLNGLTVKQESVTKALRQAKHAYVDKVGFYSLRNEEKRVQGTLQVSGFGPSARVSDKDFRTQIINESLPGTPGTVNISGTSVEQATGTKSVVTVWFSEDRLIVLTVLKAYIGARGLLEQAVVALPGR